MHYANHVLLICVCGFTDKITKDFTPSKTFRFRSNCKVQIHTILAYMNNLILSLFPFAPPHFLCSQHHSCYHCQAVNQLPLGVSPPAQEQLSMLKISFRNLNTHKHAHTHIHAERKVHFYGYSFFWDAFKRLGVNFYSRYTTNKQLLVCS